MLKVGIGFDAHAFATASNSGDKLILGGVAVPYIRSLVAHSDGDVVVHAVIDSLAGVCLGKDIGQLFPDSDVKYKGADSIKLLEEVVSLVNKEGYKVSNTDVVIIAQEPKMSPHVSAMCERLAHALNVELSSVSVKATTTEYLGFTGRKEGIAAVAVSMVEKVVFYS
ncbi:2-C-methyl-D-erythritol 2,4-cyclodiphosphate synthase [Deferribacterales bacterium RsTz2092]|nr:2-C-methyl-D-erythritol 2,4-cyclodiphosphate synthase [Deferribacterales bacterium]